MRAVFCSFDRFQKVFLVLLALCFLSIPVVFALSTIPFEPYAVRAYHIESDEVCPGQSIGVSVTRRLEDPLLGRVKSIQVVDSHWEARDGLSTAVATYPPLAPREVTGQWETIRSPNIRTAPRDMGIWRLVVNTRVEGSIVGISRAQYVHYVSAPLLAVQGPDEPGC